LSWKIFFHTGKRLSGFPASSGKRGQQAFLIARLLPMAVCAGKGKRGIQIEGQGMWF
jgi:hypothetical protein